LLEVKQGEIIETFDGLKGEVVAVYNRTVVVDFSSIEEWSNLFEFPKQVVKLKDIKRSVKK
jgi:uncharacterized protein YkvS